MRLNECLLTDTSLLAEYEDTAVPESSKKVHAGVIFADILIIALAIISVGVFLFVCVGGRSFSKLTETARYAAVSLAVVVGAGCVSGCVCRVALTMILRHSCCGCCGHGRQEIREVVETLLCDYIFSPNIVEQFMTEKTRGLCDRDVMESRIRMTIDSTEFQTLVEGIVSAFLGSPEGIGISALGYTREFLTPLVLSALKDVVLVHSRSVMDSVVNLDITQTKKLAASARNLLISRCERVDNKMISDTLVTVVGINLNFIVSASVLAGAGLALVARVASYLAGYF